MILSGSNAGLKHMKLATWHGSLPEKEMSLLWGGQDSKDCLGAQGAPDPPSLASAWLVRKLFPFQLLSYLFARS